ncbi:MAG: hypothetical protein RLZZ106_1607 [Cyanobacteriota bacterium]|jgi:hypothetical protein
MQSPPVLKVRLVHAEPGQRVVQASAWQGNSCLGSALGEAAAAEEAEERAIARLQRRLAETTPAGAPEPAAAPAANAPVRHPVIRPATTPAAPPMVETIEQVQIAGPEPQEPPQPSLFGGTEPGPPAETRPPAASVEPPADPEDWSDELAELDVQLQRIGWDRSQEEQYLQRAFGHPSRNRLTAYADLVSYLRCLRSLSHGCDPNGAPVPLRRKDLLEQSDQLLRSLQWDASRGRELLEQNFQLSSRQQLSDEQLLQFNMLLEESLMSAAGA